MYTISNNKFKASIDNLLTLQIGYLMTTEDYSPLFKQESKIALDQYLYETESII